MKSKAKDFIKRHRIKSDSPEELIRALEDMGYELSDLDGQYNDDGELWESTGVKCFTDKTKRIVYLHSGLSEKEEEILLAHECGHIFLKHSSDNSCNVNVRDEYDANEFAHYLLSVAQSVKKRRILIIAGACLAALAVALALFFAFSGGEKQEQREFGEYYITKTGFKYHTESCPRINGKDGVKKITEEQFESGKYQPCGFCNPHSR